MAELMGKLWQSRKLLDSGISPVKYMEMVEAMSSTFKKIPLAFLEQNVFACTEVSLSKPSIGPIKSYSCRR